MNKNDEQEVRRKLRILAHVDETKNISKTCRYWGISRDTFYRWKKEYKTQGEVGLINSKPCPENPSIRVAFVIEEKILYLSLEYLMLQYWCPFTDIKKGTAPIFSKGRFIIGYPKFYLFTAKKQLHNLLIRLP